MSGRLGRRALGAVGVLAVLAALLPATASAVAAQEPDWSWLAHCPDSSGVTLTVTPAGFDVVYAGLERWDQDVLREPAWQTPITADLPEQLHVYGLQWLVSALTLSRDTHDSALLEDVVGSVADTLQWRPDSGSQSDFAWNEAVNTRRESTVTCLYGVTRDARLLPLMQALATANIDPSRYYGAPLHGAHNHGLMANLALLGAASLLDRPDWRDAAVSRLRTDIATSFTAVGLGREQSSGYDCLLVSLWAEASTALRQLSDPSASPVADTIDATLVRARRALQLLVAPDGAVAAFGDAACVVGPVPVLPETTLVDKEAGVLAGRWTWTAPDDFYAVRFGGPRRMHGHEDRMSFVWWASRRPVVVDPGTYSYSTGPQSVWQTSPRAHSVAVVRGRALRPLAPIALRQSRQSGPIHQVVLEGYPYGVLQWRTITIDSANDSLELRDSARASRVDEFFQLDPRWHLLALRPGRRTALFGDSTGAVLTLTTTGQVASTMSGMPRVDGGWVFGMTPPTRTAAIRVVITGGGSITTRLVVRGPSLRKPPQPARTRTVSVATAD